MDRFKNKKIAVLGYQVEGQSLINFLIKHNLGPLTVFDENPVQLTSDHVQRGVNLVIEDFSKVSFDDYDIVYHSPGIKPSRIKVDISKLTSSINLFFEQKKGKVIGITGTKGKSTTALLIKQLLQQNGKKVFLAGNIGQSPLDFVDDLSEEDFTILELSSFQLQDFKYSPDYAVILPLFPDHLNYHDDEGEYYLAKSKIFSASDATKVIAFEGDKSRLGLDEVSNEKILYGISPNTICYPEGNILKCDEENVADNINEFCLKNHLPLINLIAAGALAWSMDFKIDLDRFSDFEKLPMRIEEIGEYSGVKFYNDSASTNPISTAAAISLMRMPFALIIGGASKNISLQPLIDEMQRSRYLIRTYVIGESREDIVGAIKKSNYQGELIERRTLQEVFEEVKIDDVRAVLFSPAFASFDQYENYKKRGEDFNKLFKILCKDM